VLRRITALAGVMNADFRLGGVRCHVGCGHFRQVLGFGDSRSWVLAI
jgi:hypothetical protein